jgi:hypothetical protein
MRRMRTAEEKGLDRLKALVMDRVIGGLIQGGFLELSTGHRRAGKDRKTHLGGLRDKAAVCRVVVRRGFEFDPDRVGWVKFVMPMRIKTMMIDTNPQMNKESGPRNVSWIVSTSNSSRLALLDLQISGSDKALGIDYLHILPAEDVESWDSVPDWGVWSRTATSDFAYHVWYGVRKHNSSWMRMAKARLIAMQGTGVQS